MLWPLDCFAALAMTMELTQQLLGHRLTLLIENDSPGKDKADWLPSPAGPFSVIMPLYWPEAEALDGTWTTPPLTRAD